jgi:hypothetical protein
MPHSQGIEQNLVCDGKYSRVCANTQRQRRDSYQREQWIAAGAAGR